MILKLASVMATSSHDARILSRPCRVVWAGWESTTTSLQQRGWSISVDYDVRCLTYRMAIHNREMKLYGISSETRIDPAFSRMDHQHDPDELPTFTMQAVAANIRVQSPTIAMSPGGFQAIDAMPIYTEEAITRIEDTNIFNIPLTRAEEIVIDKADMSVIEHLEAIKELQQPEQKRIRERVLREGRNPEGYEVREGPALEVVANLVAVA